MLKEYQRLGMILPNIAKNYGTSEIDIDKIAKIHKTNVRNRRFEVV